MRLNARSGPDRNHILIGFVMAGMEFLGDSQLGRGAVGSDAQDVGVSTMEIARQMRWFCTWGTTTHRPIALHVLHPAGDVRLPSCLSANSQPGTARGALKSRER